MSADAKFKEYCADIERRCADLRRMYPLFRSRVPHSGRILYAPPVIVASMEATAKAEQAP